MQRLRNIFLCFSKRIIMENKDVNMVEIPKSKISQMHLLFFLINLVIPIILDHFALVRDVMFANPISVALNPDTFDLNPLFNYKLSMIISIVLVSVYIIVAIVASIIKSFDRSFLNVTALIAAVVYLLFFVIFLFPPLEGWQLYLLFIAYLGRYFLAIGGILYLILLLSQTKRAVQEMM